MSKNDHRSKYLSSFYSSTSQNVPKTVSSTESTKASDDADKFKNPGDFFKSSQQNFSPQTTVSSQMKKNLPAVKSSGFNRGGSTHSNVFQQKKPSTLQTEGLTGLKKNVPPNRHYFGVDETLASTKALELQWTTKMRLAKKAEEALFRRGNVNNNFSRNDIGKSPLSKTSWADSSFTDIAPKCQNQQNDPWYSNDVWGDDLPVEAIDECLRVASSQEPNQLKSTNRQSDPLYSWIDEPWASPVKSKQKFKSPSSARTLFQNRQDQTISEDFSSLLAEDDNSFIACLENLESQVPLSNSKLPNETVRTKLSSVNIHNKRVPFSDRLPISSTTGKSSFVVKAKEYESPRKDDSLSQSQRKLQKPVKSLPSPSTSKLGFTTEWLRGQLEKINSDYSTLKEDVQAKEGESKLLRDKLKSAEEEVKKHKLEKVKEIENLREAFEKKVKQLEKQLEATQTEALFKVKEAKSNLVQYQDKKYVKFGTPERPIKSDFKTLLTSGLRPGEIIEDRTVSTDVIDETIYDAFVEGTPEKSMFDDSQEDILPLFTLKSICSSYMRKNDEFSRAVDQVVHGAQPKRELNHFLTPEMEYLPHILLHTEFSEQDFENYLIRRPTLIELWGSDYDAFGEVTLNDYEKTAIGDALPPDPAKNILSASRHFSDLKSLHSHLIGLSNKSKWGSSERSTVEMIVRMATTMARELYATLGDPRLLQTSYTIYDRDPKILKEFQDCAELVELFDCLSPKNWKNESFVELRRCLVLVGHLCSIDHVTARRIVNPKAHKLPGSNDYFQPYSEPILSKLTKDEGVALKIFVQEGERKPSELKLMTKYRDLHSKKLTLVSELASNLVVNTPVKTTNLSPMKITSQMVEMDVDQCIADKALQVALQSIDNFTCNNIIPNSASSKAATPPTFEEYQSSLNKLDLHHGLDLYAMMAKMEGELNPQKVKLWANISAPIQPAKSSGYLLKDWDRVANWYRNIIQNKMLNVDLGNNGEVICAPVDRCITVLEKQLMELTLNNQKQIKIKVEQSVNSSTNLDLCQYVSDIVEDEFDLSRKRKVFFDEDVPRKMSKVEGYRTPPFDKSLYSQIRTNTEDDIGTQPLSPTNDNQLAKFEKREAMAELEKKMLAKEVEADHKYNKRALAPFKLPKATVATCEDTAGEEVVMEIEKMFHSQTKPEVNDSTLSSESDDDVFERIKTNGEEIEIEFIPNLLTNFHGKLKNAGLLELLCEIFKEGGVLRFTHRLNGVMLGTLVMLQKMVAYQKAEVEPYCGKIATIIREILYTRPSPRILLEINVLLRYCVTIPNFSKMLCHNASGDTFVIKPDQVNFTREACLLEVVCILVTYATDEETDCRIYFELSHWVYYIICGEKKHLASLFEMHNKSRRRCMCIAALNNTMVMIYHRTLATYRGRLVSLLTNTRDDRILEDIVLHGIQVLRFIHSYGYSSFLFSIKNQYHEYNQFLNWMKEMHENDGFFKNFVLSKIDLIVLTKLLKDLTKLSIISENVQVSGSPSDFKTYFRPGKPWPYDINNMESLLTSHSNESDDD